MWISDSRKLGTVKEKAYTPRSYIVQTPAGQPRRNRRHLRFIPEDEKVGTVKGERELIHPVKLLFRKKDRHKKKVPIVL